MKKLSKLLPDASIAPTGSRYVCSPPVLFTDVDFLIYSNTKPDAVLIANGFSKTTWERYAGQADDFDAWRRGKVNLIVTTRAEWATGFHTATSICKRFNLRYKMQRVVVHEAFRGHFNANDADQKQLIGPVIRHILAALNGPHANALHKAYRIQHNLGDFP